MRPGRRNYGRALDCQLPKPGEGCLRLMQTLKQDETGKKGCACVTRLPGDVATDHRQRVCILAGAHQGACECLAFGAECRTKRAHHLLGLLAGASP